MWIGVNDLIFLCLSFFICEGETRSVPASHLGLVEDSVEVLGWGPASPVRYCPCKGLGVEG